LIKLSDATQVNEAMFTKYLLYAYPYRRSIEVIINLKNLEKTKPFILLGFLNRIRKEVDFFDGELKLCSLNPEIDFFFKDNRLDRFFEDHADFRITPANIGRY
jgi:hypothetical protein